MTTVVKPSALHPAQFSRELLEPIAATLKGILDGAPGELLDPFGGLGWRLAAIAARAGLEPVAVEIEPAYLPHAHPCVTLGDSTKLPAEWSSRFAAAVTSPVYPNGMSDNFHSGRDAGRNTYIHRIRHVLGDPTYELAPNNAAGLNPRRSPGALQAFHELNTKVYVQVHRCLRPGAPFIVNVKAVPVCPNFPELTRNTLAAVGFHIWSMAPVRTRGLRHGEHVAGVHHHEELLILATKGPSA